MFKRYCKAVLNDTAAKELIGECVGWLQGDYNAIDTYDLAQFYFDLTRYKGDTKAITGLRAVLLSDAVSHRTKTWDNHVCLAIVACLASEHNFKIEVA